MDLLALSLNKKKGRASVYGWDQLPLEVTLVTDRSVRSIAAKGSLYSESCQSPYGGIYKLDEFRMEVYIII